MGNEALGTSLNLKFSRRHDMEFIHLFRYPSSRHATDEHVIDHSYNLCFLCIYEQLVARGIAPERILLEDRSTSTKENLTWSLEALDGRAARIGLVTNDFHIFRAVCIGRACCGVELSPIPARSTWSGFVHYAMREFFALCLQYTKGELAFA